MEVLDPIVVLLPLKTQMKIAMICTGLYERHADRVKGVYERLKPYGLYEQRLQSAYEWATKIGDADAAQMIRDSQENGSWLYDMLCSGCALPYAHSSFPDLNQNVEDDILFCLEHSPWSMQWNGGNLRCRDMVSPLAIATFNGKVKVSIVRRMFERGAHPYARLRVNGRDTDVLTDHLQQTGHYRDRRTARLTRLYREFGYHG